MNGHEVILKCLSYTHEDDLRFSLQSLRINVVTVVSNVHTLTMLEGVIWVISLEATVGSGQSVGRFSFCGNHGGCLKERKQRLFAQRFLSWGREPALFAHGGFRGRPGGRGAPQEGGSLSPRAIRRVLGFSGRCSVGNRARVGDALSC